jgi:anhydro-N-acetylmuramic acid kinase
LDQWIRFSKGKKYDVDGQWAESGCVINSLLSSMLDDPYFALPFPKSTGTDYFNLYWLEKQLTRLKNYDPKDVQATLLALSVQSIALGLQRLHQNEGELFICGGGVHNSALVKSLTHHLSNFKIASTEDLGVPADWVEAVGFAWLGYCKLHDIPSNLPSVTGARGRVILGEVFSPQR